VQSTGWLPALLAVPIFILVGLLAGIDPKLGVLAAVGIVFVLVALTDLAAALVVLIIVVFAESTPLAGPALSATKIAGLLLLLGWIARLATQYSGRETVIFTAHPGFSYLLALFMSWVALSLVWAENVHLALDQASVFLLVAILYVIVFTAIRTRRQAIWVIGAFVLGTAIMAAYGLVLRPDPNGQAADRLASTIQDPNYLAAFLVAGVALGGAAFVAARGHRWLQLGALTSVALCLAAFVLTGSRGGIIGLAVALIVAIAFAGRWRARIAVSALVLTISAVGYYTIYAPEDLTQRIASASEGELDQRDTRLTIWTVAWRMAKDNPIHGVGIGNFPVESINYVLEPGTTFRTDRVIDNPPVAHNSYLGPLAELGIVGVSMFIAILGFSFGCAVRAARRFARNDDLSMEALARGLVVALAGVLTAGIFISAESNKVLWLLLAMGPALLAVADSAERTPRPRPHPVI
jgi:O-antigen ligase